VGAKALVTVVVENLETGQQSLVKTLMSAEELELSSAEVAGRVLIPAFLTAAIRVAVVEGGPRG